MAVVRGKFSKTLIMILFIGIIVSVLKMVMREGGGGMEGSSLL